MGVKVTLECGGCDATVEYRLRRWNQVLVGGAFAIGGVSFDKVRVVTDDVEHAPGGWMVFDPYTYCTYCPECWASVEGREATAAQGTRSPEEGR